MSQSEIINFFLLNRFTDYFWLSVIFLAIMFARPKRVKVFIVLLVALFAAIIQIADSKDQSQDPVAFESKANKFLEDADRYNDDLLVEEFDLPTYAALKKASMTGYYVRAFTININGVSRRIVLLGETHMKISKAEKVAGDEAVKRFNVIAVEGWDPEPGIFNHISHTILSLYDFPLEMLVQMMPDMAGSSIESAYDLADNEFSSPSVLTKDDLANRSVYWLENGRLSAFDQDYENMKDPAKSVIIDKRNLRMVANLKSFLAINPEVQDVLVVVGALHVEGMMNLLSNDARISSIDRALEIDPE